jgi:hypothetical protein
MYFVSILLLLLRVYAKGGCGMKGAPRNLRSELTPLKPLPNSVILNLKGYPLQKEFKTQVKTME